MTKKENKNQFDLFGFDQKDIEAIKEQQKNAKAEFTKKINKLRKASDLKEQKEIENLERIQEQEEYELLKYIKNNYKNIIIPEIEVVEHKQSAKGIFKSKRGFINFVLPYPIFPHKNDDELELAKKALIWFEETLDLWIVEPRSFMIKFLSYLGGIRAKDAYTFYGKAIKDLGYIGKFNESKYFTNLYMFDEESRYMNHMGDDISILQFTETGFHFGWEYPEYFQIIESDFNKFAKRLWDELLEVEEVWYV